LPFDKPCSPYLWMRRIFGINRICPSPQIQVSVLPGDSSLWDVNGQRGRQSPSSTPSAGNDAGGLLIIHIQGVRPGVCIERPGWCMLISIWPYDSMDWANKYRLS
jgi:hypothetical protein